MPKSKRVKPQYDDLDYKSNHAEYEIKETRVSDFLRRYGTGHIEDVPQNKAPEISNERVSSAMDTILDKKANEVERSKAFEVLNEETEGFIPSMATETIDVLAEIEANKERFEKAFNEIELTKTASKKYKDALSVINNPNAPLDAKREAYATLDSLITNGYARARN